MFHIAAILEVLSGIVIVREFVTSMFEGHNQLIPVVEVPAQLVFFQTKNLLVPKSATYHLFPKGLGKLDHTGLCSSTVIILPISPPVKFGSG